MSDAHRRDYEAGRIDTTDGKPPQSFEPGAPAPIGANGRHAQYWVLSEAERAKGFVRPVRSAYKHVGKPGPRFALRALTDEEIEQTKRDNPGWETASSSDDLWAYFEPYPDGEPALGRYWTGRQLKEAGKGCGTVTTMGRALAETYAREPGFYGATMCVGCGTHLRVGRDGEFVWTGTDERVGT